MKLNTAIFLALGFAASAAGPIYAADSGTGKQDQSSMSNGMTSETAEKNYQDAMTNCMKKTGTAKSRCVKSAAKKKCKGLTGTEKSTCMKEATEQQSGSSEDSMGRPADDSSGQPGSQTRSPGGSYK